MLKGCFVGVRENADTFVLEKTFRAPAAKKAVLRATAPGTYFAEINGVRVGDAYLAPGWTTYGKTLQVQEYDVTALLREGENTLSFTVNEGWYSGPLTWQGKRALYGEKPAVCADLYADGKLLLSSSEEWSARESFIRKSGIYDGETQDFTAERAALTPCAVAFDKKVLVPQICEPVRTTQRLPVREVIRTPKGELVYDFGQNFYHWTHGV